jgi:hypothetical protein
MFYDFSCFCSLTFILSAGSDINEVKTEASIADVLSFINFEVVNNLSNSSEIIYLDAS